MNTKARRAADWLISPDLDFAAAIHQRFWREGKIIESIKASKNVKIILLGQMAAGASVIAGE